MSGGCIIEGVCWVWGRDGPFDYMRLTSVSLMLHSRSTYNRGSISSRRYRLLVMLFLMLGKSWFCQRRANNSRYSDMWLIVIVSTKLYLRHECIVADVASERYSFHMNLCTMPLIDLVSPVASKLNSILLTYLVEYCHGWKWSGVTAPWASKSMFLGLAMV
jgi:hypothetical protein